MGKRRKAARKAMWRARLSMEQFVEKMRREAEKTTCILENRERLYELSDDAWWEEQKVRQNPLRDIIYRIPMPPPIQALHVKNFFALKEFVEDKALSDAQKWELVVKVEVMHRLYLRWCIDTLLRINPPLGIRIIRQVRRVRERAGSKRRETEEEMKKRLSQPMCIIGVGARWNTLIVECRPSYRIVR